MKYLKFAIGLLISAVCIWWVLKDINYPEVGKALGGLNWWLLALSYIPYFIIMGLKITRWQVLLYPDKLPFAPLFSALCISYFWNTVLPARLGEIVRGYVVSFRFKIGVVRVLSTILLEKILDVTVNIVFLLCLLPFLKLNESVKTTAFIIGGVIIVGVTVALIMAAMRRQSETFIRFCLKPLPQKFGNKLFDFACQVLDSLAVLLNPRLSFNIIAQSVIMWAINMTTYWIIGYAIGLPLTFEQALWVMIATNLGMVVPSAPGYIGVFHAIVVESLKPFYSDTNLLFSYGIIMHLSGFIPVVVLGAIFSGREGLTMSQVQKSKTATEPLEPGVNNASYVETPALKLEENLTSSNLKK